MQKRTIYVPRVLPAPLGLLTPVSIQESTNTLLSIRVTSASRHWPGAVVIESMLYHSST